MKSPLQPFAPAAARSRPKPHPAKVIKYNTLRNNFSIGTWIVLGSVLQGVASLLLPRRYALAPAVSLLAFRLLRTGLMCLGLVPNPHMDEVFLGKFTSLIPSRDGSPPKHGSDQEVTVMILATRSNHPLGIFAPGYKELSTLFGKLLAELHRNAEATGFLGNTAWLNATEQYNTNQLMVLVYFRSREELEAFAHGPSHRRAWDWWHSITATHPHLSIMHEVYHAPAGHWENIWVNNHLSGIAATVARMDGPDGQRLRPLFEAGRGPLRTHLGRLGGGDGRENEKYGEAKY